MERALWIGHFEKYPANWSTDFLLAFLIMLTVKVNSEKGAKVPLPQEIAPWLADTFETGEPTEKGAKSPAERAKKLCADLLDAVNSETDNADGH